METQKLLESLHPFERKVLPFLDKISSLHDLAEASRLEEIEVMRALQWLENKDIVKLERSAETVVKLGENGKKYAQNDLPEKRLLKLLSKQELTLRQISLKSDLSR